MNDKIIFTGYIDEDINKIISQFDGIISATRSFEGFGLTIAEALNQGVPVIATKVGAVPEIFNNDVVQLIEPNSPSEIRAAIITFMNNRKRYQDEAVRGQEEILKISKEMPIEFKRTFQFSVI